jgi:U3 small nucleolar RNA-associated protein 18
MVAQQEGEAASVECMDWHPSARVRILMTASRDRTVRLFEIDGNSNPLLQSLHVPSLPLTYAAFHPSGSSVLLAGPRPYLYAYDLQSGRALRSTPWRGLSNDGNTAERDLSMARFQPLGAESGRLLAIGGRRGAIHLLDWGSGQGGAGAGAGAALVGSLRLNAPLVGLEWDQTASAAGRRLLSLSKEGSVHVWDTRAMRCAVERRDAGLFGAHGLAQSPSGAHWAVGSDSGTVNVYDALTASEVQDNKPWASVKELGNLVTRTTTLSWNHDGQMLAVASRNKKDALKLVSLAGPSSFSQPGLTNLLRCTRPRCVSLPTGRRPARRSATSPTCASRARASMRQSRTAAAACCSTRCGTTCNEHASRPARLSLLARNEADGAL